MGGGEEVQDQRGSDVVRSQKVELNLTLVMQYLDQVDQCVLAMLLAMSGPRGLSRSRQGRRYPRLRVLPAVLI